MCTILEAFDFAGSSRRTVTGEKNSIILKGPKRLKANLSNLKEVGGLSQT